MAVDVVVLQFGIVILDELGLTSNITDTKILQLVIPVMIVIVQVLAEIVEHYSAAEALAPLTPRVPSRVHHTLLLVLVELQLNLFR